MGDQLESTRFRAIFDSSLQAYEKKTGIALAQHPLTVQLQSCRSVDSITALMQDQTSTFSEFGGTNRITTSIKSTISILTTLSAATFLGNAIGGLVRQRGTDRVFHI
jgi:hypothetical protein